MSANVTVWPGLRCTAVCRAEWTAGFNIAVTLRSRGGGSIWVFNPTLSKMTATRIEFQAGKITRLSDASDLAELLFPGNRNQQHAFLVVWITLKWASPSLVPNVAQEADQHQVSRRTLERVRAKLRRLGLIERISRFHARFAGCEGWALSPRFEYRLRQLADKVALLRSPETSSLEKDRLLVDLADARRAVPFPRPPPTTRGE